MTLTLTVIVTIGIAVTIGVYLFSRHHLAVLADRVAETVRLEADAIRQKAQESGDRLINAFLTWGDEAEAVKAYQREQAELLAADTIAEPWNWQESELLRWAGQTQRDRCAAGRRSARLVASATILSVWTIIAVVTLVGLRERETMVLTPGGPDPFDSTTSGVPDPWHADFPGTGKVPGIPPDMTDFWHDDPLAQGPLPAIPLDSRLDPLTGSPQVGVPGSDPTTGVVQVDRETTTNSAGVATDEPPMDTGVLAGIQQEQQE